MVTQIMMGLITTTVYLVEEIFFISLTQQTHIISIITQVKQDGVYQLV
jgi:hypothetical protein